MEITQDRVAMAERPAPGVLPAQSHRDALEQERAQREQFGVGVGDLGMVAGAARCESSPRVLSLGLSRSLGLTLKPSGTRPSTEATSVSS